MASQRSRTKILGAPYVLGQCIGPQETLSGELGLDSLSPNPRHPDLVQSKVMLLDGNLSPKSGDLGRVRETSVKMDVHLLLMEMNVSSA